MTTSAAILLCAGKGTRMGDASKNKVAFDCAGVPVVRRIVDNMRAGGVTRFVVVVGHRAESVMAALDGVPGILYAYQAEQRGTGHATRCGLRVLAEIGFTGPVIVSMGDKLVSERIVREILAKDVQLKAVFGVQPHAENPRGGHVVFAEGQPLGIVESADVRKAAETGVPVTLGGRSFSAAELQATPYVNTAFYRFDASALATALQDLRSDNAQGEIYLTDVIERFASEKSLSLYVIDNPSDMLTYSTRPELRRLAHRFLRPASSFLSQLSALNSPLPSSASHHSTLNSQLSAFISRYGDRPCVIASAPGRVNLMGRHIEHRGGSVNMMAIGARTVFIAAPRADDVVNIANLDAAFPPASFSISALLDPSRNRPGNSSASGTAAWLDFLESAPIKADLEASRGHWVNYVKSAVLRFQMASAMPLCGMDILAAGDIPVAAGLSSSSSVVVATAEALVALNALNVSTPEFVELCGEGEWYVGSRGGPGDHAAMKCSCPGRITHLKFKPFGIGESVPFPAGYSVVVVDSGEQAKKSEGARDTFNARIRDYETAFNDVKRHYPDLPIAYFRDLAFLPEGDCAKALAVLAGTVKGVATFGVKECRRAEQCLELLKRGDMSALGAMMKESHDGDRLGKGEYECSTVRIDALCDRLDAFPGVLGAQLVGAGLGGCVIALVKTSAVESLLAELKPEFKAFVCVPSEGSKVEF